MPMAEASRVLCSDKHDFILPQVSPRSKCVETLALTPTSPPATASHPPNYPPAIIKALATGPNSSAWYSFPATMPKLVYALIQRMDQYQPTTQAIFINQTKLATEFQLSRQTIGARLREAQRREVTLCT